MHMYDFRMILSFLASGTKPRVDFVLLLSATFLSGAFAIRNASLGLKSPRGRGL